MASQKTPAPSKRFLTPRFSSSARQSAPPFTQKNQSPSWSATPLRFATPSKQQQWQEEINTSFEHEALALSDSQRLRGFASRSVRGTDAIDDADADVDADIELADTDNNLDVDLIDGKGTQYYYNVQGGAGPPVTPHPRKRRKVSTTLTKRANEPLVISSSPSNPASDANASDDGGNDSSSDLELDPDSPSGKPTTATARHGSRFKMMPSQATPLLVDTEYKPVFRQPDPKLHLAAEMATVLPDAFTPSRRKGRKEYLPGGFADSVRNAVLGIATEISQTGGQPPGTIVLVKSARVDASGRAIIATSHDGDHWVLPALPSRRGESEEPCQQVRSITASGGFLLFSSASHWPLPNIQSDSGESVRFASHWRIPTPGDWNK
ncbi:hypothetical protein DV738_g724, partial [Chaetothyriales sp. CBS 135597]